LQAKGIKPEKALRDAETVGRIIDALPDKPLTTEKIVAIVQQGLNGGGDNSGHQWPPIINLSEANGRYFKSGSAELSSEFQKDLLGPIPKRILQLAKKYDVDIIEVVGHTDEQPLGGQPSNLDRDLVPVLKGSANIATALPSDNAGLGLARAVSVVSVLLQNASLAKYKLLPLSGAQLINTDETLATSGVPANIPERRRIEIRLRKSTPHDLAITALPTTRITDAKPQRPKPASPPPPARQTPASPWTLFPVR
jgi:hypothetical protein